MNKKLPAWIVLTVICLVAALALAFTYNGTKDRIAQQEEAKTVAVRQALLPAAASFEAVDGSEVYRGVDANGAAVGYVTVNTVKGFGGDDMGWQTPITREQLVTMLHRFAQLIGKA